MDIGHDLFKLTLHVGKRPRQARRVLAHLQPGNRHSPGIGCLGRAEHYARIGQQRDSIKLRRHVGAFADSRDAALEQATGIPGVDFILRGAWKRDVARDHPGPGVGMVGGRCESLCVLGDATAPNFLQFPHPAKFLVIDSVWVMNASP